MKTLKIVSLLLVFHSCSVDQKGKQDCFLGQIGKYKIDFDKTIRESGEIKFSLLDSTSMANFIIEFRSDSTFVTNGKFFLFSDTFGKWDAGNCGFEDPGTITYFSSSIKQQFGACRPLDSFFTIMSHGDNQQSSKLFWFKKERQD